MQRRKTVPIYFVSNTDTTVRKVRVVKLVKLKDIMQQVRKEILRDKNRYDYSEKRA